MRRMASVGLVMLALAACAYAARLHESETTLEHLKTVAELVLRHRLPDVDQLNNASWSEEQDSLLTTLLEHG